MKVLSFDQSTRITGYSVFEDGQCVENGIINLAKITDTEERSKQMGLAICKVINRHKPQQIIIEEVAMQSNPSTLKKLARIQGVAIGFAAAHNIPLHILEPTKWRAALSYKQGPRVKREDLKKQSLDFVKKNFGLEPEEDIAEAICINEAAHRIYGWALDDEI